MLLSYSSATYKRDERFYFVFLLWHSTRHRNVLDLFKSCKRVIWKYLLKLFLKERDPISQLDFTTCSWAPFLALCCQCIWFAVCMWCYVPYCHNLGRSSKLKSSPHWNETPILRRNSDLFSLTLELELNLQKLNFLKGSMRLVWDWIY